MLEDFLPREIKLHLKDELEPAPDYTRTNKAYICPFCGSGTGNSATKRYHKPTGALKITPDGTHFTCFSCGEHGDILDLVSKRDGLDTTEARELLMQRYGNGGGVDFSSTGIRKASAAEVFRGEDEATTRVAPSVDTPEPDKARADYIAKAASALPGTEGERYLHDRGFTDETIQRFNLGYDAARDGIVIPYPGTDFYTLRLIHPTGEKGKYYKPKGIHEPLFNGTGITDDTEVVFYCEGQLDAIALMQAGAEVAVAIGGSGYSKLSGYKLPDYAVVVRDNDEPGAKTADNIATALKTDNIVGIIAAPPEQNKDVNEALINDPGNLTALVTKWAEDALTKHDEALTEHNKARTTERLTTFLQVLQQGRGQAVPTGFDSLDNVLGGGLYPGLYILGAITSMGKTALLLQIADQIAGQGYDCLYFSLEMASSELMSRSISRYTYQNYRLIYGDDTTKQDELCKTARGIATPAFYKNYSDETKEAIQAAVESYEEITDHLYIYEGIGDIGVEQIKQTVEAHIKLTGNKPVVFIDYLQILAPYDIRATDKQNTDKAVLELKRLSRDKDLPVLAISSFNRDNYSTEVNLTAFKESGAIEYGSDVLLALQPVGMKSGGTKQDQADNVKLVENCKRSIKRKVEVKVLKQRNGKTGDRVDFTYNAAYNNFSQGYGFLDADDDSGIVVGAPAEADSSFLPAGTVTAPTKRQKTRERLAEAYRQASTDNPFDDTVSLYQLAEILDVSQATVRRYLKEYGGYTLEKDGNVEVTGEVDQSETVTKKETK